MNLKDLFEKNLLKISFLKSLNIQNSLVIKLLGLEAFKDRTFSRYLIFQKKEIEEIGEINKDFFDELKEEYLSHRNVEILLRKIDLNFFNNIEEDLKNDDLEKNDFLKDQLISKDEKKPSLIVDNIDDNINDNKPQDDSLYSEENINAKRNKLEEISKKGVDLQSLIFKERLKSKKQ